jgi:hypothetical protein
MKGRLYIPHTTVNSPIGSLVQTPKPWTREEEVQVYMWRTSIPEKWLKIKGDKGFQHVSETGKNKNTMDFLNSNQKYINAISDHRTRALSKISVLSSRKSTPRSTRELHIVPGELKNSQLSLGEIKNNSSDPNPNDLSKPISYSIPSKGKRLVSYSSLKSILLELPSITHKSKMKTNHSVPKMLIAVKKQNPAAFKFKNSELDLFFQRFEKKNQGFGDYIPRKGINGWKLVKPKKK